MNQSETKGSLEYLAGMLENAVPAITSIKRGGWLLSANKPIDELMVRFDDFHYRLVRQKHGSVIATEMKLVRGVVLKTSDIPVDQCIDSIVRQLVKLSESNAEARSALSRFMTGGL
jgi:hypothetical protein